MRSTKLFAVTAVLIVAGIGGWAASNTLAGVAAPTGGGIDPFQIMVNAKQLPNQQIEDFSSIN
jgi:hypothetical protein